MAQAGDDAMPPVLALYLAILDGWNGGMARCSPCPLPRMARCGVDGRQISGR